MVRRVVGKRYTSGRGQYQKLKIHLPGGMWVAQADGDTISGYFIFTSISGQDFFKYQVGEIWIVSYYLRSS